MIIDHYFIIQIRIIIFIKQISAFWQVIFIGGFVADYTPFNYKKIKMPLALRLKIFVIKKLRRKNTELQREFMREMGRRRRLTEKRENIEWYPGIDESLCTGCNVCIDFCPKKVFVSKSRNKKAKVANPYECVMLCRGCMPKCPEGAISFPDPEEFKRYVYYV